MEPILMLKPPEGNPALFRAVSKGRLEIVKLLLEHGSDIDATPPVGDAALYRLSPNEKVN